MKCDACFWKPHTRQYFSVPTKKNQLIALRHITPAVKVFHKRRHSAYGVLASAGRTAGFAVSIPVFDKSIYGYCFRLSNSKGRRKPEKLFYGNGIRMVIAGGLAGRIVFFQLICQTEKGFRHSAPAEKAVFRTAERTFDIPKKQVMLKAEQGISILGTRLVGNFQFLNLKPVQCGIHRKRNVIIHQVLEKCSVTGSMHVYIFTCTVRLLHHIENG